MTATDTPVLDPRRLAMRRATTPQADTMCIVVPQIVAGEGGVIARNLGRRGQHAALVLAHRSEARELVALLAGGVRGAVAIEQGKGITFETPVPRPAPPAEAPPLTARELSVLSLVAEGQSNRAIGESLGLSALTVKSHLARIARKLGTGDRAALVAVALRRGLI